MKLKVTDWRHAWFESHISDRFFQEMARLEKGSVQGLEATAQWMEQIMVEMGTLAQAMIRLEQSGPPEPQIKLAYEKALRLAALCMHLITALDGADRAQLRSAAFGHGEPAGREAHRSVVPLPAYPQPGEPRPATPPVTDPAPPAAAAAEPAPDGRFLHPLAAAPGMLRPPLAPAPPAGAAAEAEPMASPETTADAERAPTPAQPMGSLVVPPLLQISGRGLAYQESEMHQTILSLYEQGLSRAEIEVVTGEPRHVIEAVLNHARDQARAGTELP